MQINTDIAPLLISAAKNLPTINLKVTAVNSARLCYFVESVPARAYNMSSNDPQNSGDAENTCVVCFKTVEIYSIGVCDHAVCFECSTRMRVLCRQNECPICRQDLPKVSTQHY